MTYRNGRRMCMTPTRMSAMSGSRVLPGSRFPISACLRPPPLLAAVTAGVRATGLFDWQQAMRNVQPRGGVRLLHDAIMAPSAIEIDRDTDISAFTELAVFDPEGCDRHLVPSGCVIGWPRNPMYASA
ncbi:hypothetical protein [Burkholderia sp. BE17]|uniref:hypothetical protein n=1 Tax=Burkholderia sp. BE17 TaxID=2656644 RepID=UPI00128D02B3|nr:hypothetical protein [Burkholderia sp. BE17]MPV68350.1 hypothetical protein [Burkholderia sp. BE17]